MGHTLKNWSPLERWVTNTKMGHTYKDVSQVKNSVTLKKCVTVANIYHTYTVEEIGQTYQ